MISCSMGTCSNTNTYTGQHTMCGYSGTAYYGNGQTYVTIKEPEGYNIRTEIVPKYRMYAKTSLYSLISKKIV